VTPGVPSVLHQVLVEMFRHRGELAPELLRTCAGIELRHDRVEQRSVDLSQVASTEYRADSVVELRGRGDAIIAAVIVEIQLGIDAGKQHTWPIYIAALRKQLRCPVLLLVITTDASVARWARQPIALGHPGFCLEPLVVDFEDLPRIVDPARVERLPELAVLSAMAHPELAVANTALGALARLPEDQNRLYLDIILARLPDAIRKLLEARMQGYEYQSAFARKYYNEGREEGRSEGLQDAVLALLRAKLEVLSEDDEAAIKALHDLPALTALIGALGQARGAQEARAALAAVRPERR
jgi:hypothetical protein